MKMRFENAVQSYVAPAVEVTEILLEGVLCASGVVDEEVEWGAGNE